ncbi:MAG: hypothetical protein P1V97_09150 [Planctomycetota bacterium]|nr:hypothetical protein [Planctomycetota bacterium]
MTENPPQNDEAELLESPKSQDDPKNEQSEANSPAEAQSGEHKDSVPTSAATSSQQDSPETAAEIEDSNSSTPAEASSDPKQGDEAESPPAEEPSAESDPKHTDEVLPEAAEQPKSEAEASLEAEDGEEAKAAVEDESAPTEEDKTPAPEETSEPEQTPTTSPILSLDSDADLVYDIEDTRSHNVEAFRRGHKTVLLDRPDQALDGATDDPVPEPQFESEVKPTESVENSPAEIEGRRTVVYHDIVEGELSFETQAPTLDEVMVPQSVEEADELVDDSHWTETAGLESDSDNFPYVSNMPKTMRMNPDEAGRVLDESSSDVPFTDIAALDPEFDNTSPEDLENDSIDPVFDRSRSESGEFEVASLSPLEALEAVDEILDGPPPEPLGKRASGATPSDENEPDQALEAPTQEAELPAEQAPFPAEQAEFPAEQAEFPAPNDPDPNEQPVAREETEDDLDNDQDPAQASGEEDPVFPATTIPEALPYDDSGDEDSEEKGEKQTSETQLYNKVLVAPATVEDTERPVVPPKKFDRDASRRATKAMSNPLGMDEITASLQDISSNQKTTRFSDPLNAEKPIKDKPFAALDAPLEEIKDETEETTISRSASGRLERPPASSKITESKKPSSLFSSMKNRRDSQKLSPRRRPTSSLVRPDLPKKSLNTPLSKFSSNINTSAAEQAPGRIRQDALEEIFKRWQDIKKEDIDP